MKRKNSVCMLLAAATAVMLTACGGVSASSDKAAQLSYEAAEDTAFSAAGANSEIAVAEEAGAYEYNTTAQEGETAAEVPQDALAGRKLIKNVNMSVETEQFDVLIPSLEKRVAALGGYIEDMSSYSRNDDYSSNYTGVKYLRYASMTVRMPKQNLDAFLEEVGEQFNVVSRTESVTDVTLQYVDLESHKKALMTEQNRLLELMEQAETVEDIIAIEGRLSEVRYQIESMESQLRTFDNKIDYSTVYLSIDEVERYTPTEETTVGERIRSGFMDSLRGVGRGGSDFVIWVIIHLPYLIVWAVIIVVLLLILRFIKKKMAGGSTKQAQKRVGPYYAQYPGQQGVYSEQPAMNRAEPNEQPAVQNNMEQPAGQNKDAADEECR